MSRPTTNLLLLTLVLALALSGLAGWILPEPAALGWYELHRASGTALLVVLVWKYGIARQSLLRRLGARPPDRSVIAGLLAAVALAGSIGFGLAWTLQLASFEALWGYSPLNIHVQLGLVLVLLLGWHVLRRREHNPDRRDLWGRRNALRLIGLGAATALSWRGLESAAGALAPAGSRRPSGSKHAGSFTANDYPVTIWTLDRVPELDAATWQLSVSGKVATPALLSYAQLAHLPRQEASVVLDCTGGWWSEQIWSGVSVGDLLAAGGADPSARTVDVVSVTGHRWTFPLNELRGAILATHVGGEPLSPGHGYPVRLVAPNRRGFQWIKWVARIEVA